ncbi:hypothetical protein PMG71_23195 [Roseofilum sp. BLCC_M154]|uniref:Uncharacterized protein n=1 Tax=Roseofilum acuticapitatum BLCC-M154 TaxID=3022444 RepID=A0ABT7AZP5_9CYAN|nr:hypothetical protein [Roseofilum acuticapitatum]MDJ1172340.1 hypothetical protein [Roseofilum acuticapitatum BLCC-M154]
MNSFNDTSIHSNPQAGQKVSSTFQRFSTAESAINRCALHEIQVLMALRRITYISHKCLKTIEKGVKNKWIEKVSIYALDDKNLCVGELSVSVDWNLYDSLMSTGKFTIALDPRHFDKYDNQPVSIELDEAVKLFREFIGEENLKTIYQVSYPSHFKSEEINRKLGFSPFQKVKWSERKIIYKKLDVEKTPEFYIELRLIDI